VRFESVEDIAGSSSYVAVLALDGDCMGKWLSGEQTPPLLNQLSKGAQAYFGPRLQANGGIRRPLSPSYHLQFSEALADFGQWLARPIVEKFDGQLIYSGGDDVLAMLPVAKAFDCAEALRAAFRGDRESLDRLVHGLFRVYGTHGGFVALKTVKEPVPMIVPGPNADVSVGLCIAHKNSPLQGMVRAAGRAEKSAKNDYGRAALAVALHKRSGEVLTWGAQWKSGALDLLRRFRELADVGAVSGRFPYVLAERLHAYLANDKDEPGFPWGGVAKLEFAHALKRQTDPQKDERGLNDFARAVSEYLPAHVSNRRGALAFMDLFRVAAFLTRRDGDE
jgi:CRISPR/Cas system-associated protein Cas10 (large subunit of type III CRISPR-Cas system)